MSSPSHPWQAASSYGSGRRELLSTAAVLFSCRHIHPTHCFFPFPFCIWAVCVTCTQEVLPVAGVGFLLLLLSFLLFPLSSCNSCLLGDHPSSFLLPHPKTSPYVALSRNSTALPEKEAFKPKYLHYICPDPQSAQFIPAQPSITYPFYPTLP